MVSYNAVPYLTQPALHDKVNIYSYETLPCHRIGSKEGLFLLQVDMAQAIERQE